MQKEMLSRLRRNNNTVILNLFQDLNHFIRRNKVEMLKQVQHDNMGVCGFTLIELLVVVLIIGILVAVALPQYQKVVDKARISAYLPVLKGIAKAQARYYLSSNEYATDLSTLDVDPSSVCPEYSNFRNYMLINCQGGAILDNRQAYGQPVGDIYLSYCPNLAGKITTSNYTACQGEDNVLELRVPYDKPEQIICSARQARGQKLCALFTNL